MSTATAITGTTVLVIGKSEMIRALHAKHALSDRFISYMLSRNIRVEEDLTDQLFNSTEKRLVRTLLLLASYGKQGQPQKMLPKISQETLAGMVGTTRSRVNVFMNKFKKLGFIDYKDTIRINELIYVCLAANPFEILTTAWRSTRQPNFHPWWRFVAVAGYWCPLT
jgi:CRP-like cAMP-binding protein